jgi:hypothetical protein
MTLGRYLRLFLAAALLAAWQGALVHPLEHVDERGGHVHVAGAHQDRDDGDGESGPNPLCDLIAAAGTCVGSAAPADLPDAVHAIAVPALALAVRPGPLLLSYRSQAPPTVS